MLPELEDLSQFSEDAQQIARAIVSANVGDEGTERLAVRHAREITIWRAHIHDDTRPILATLLYCDRDAPVYDILSAIGQWIGQPPTGERPFTLIDCTIFAPGTNNLALLLGPPQAIGGMTPMLSDLYHSRPDLLVRAGIAYPMLEQLEDDVQTVFEKGHALGAVIDAKQLVSLVKTELDQWLRDLRTIRATMVQSLQPFRSILVFDDIASASPELIHTVRRLVMHARINSSMNFDDAIILIVCYDTDHLLDAGAPNEKSGQRFARILRALRAKPSLRGLVEDLGDHIVIIGPRTEGGQRERIETMLSDIARKLSALDLKISFTEGFKKFLLEQSRDPDDPRRFPNQRLEHKIDQFVRLPLAQALRSGTLKAGSSLRFAKPKRGDGHLRIAGAEPDAPPIAPEAIADAFRGPNTGVRIERTPQERSAEEPAIVRAFRTRLEEIRDLAISRFISMKTSQERSSGQYL